MDASDRWRNCVRNNSQEWNLPKVCLYFLPEFHRGNISTCLALLCLGRTHQLRVHCSSIGHPIVGDFTYSLKTDNDPYRMMLHAYHLQIPVEGESIEVTTPDPFMHTVDNNWEMGTHVNNLHNIIGELKEKYITEQFERSSTLEVQADKIPVKKPREETKEEREKCLQWLNEWAVS